MALASLISWRCSYGALVFLDVSYSRIPSSESGLYLVDLFLRYWLIYLGLKVYVELATYGIMEKMAREVE